MNASLPAMVRSVRPIEDEDGTAHAQTVTLAVDDTEFDVIDRRRFVPEASVGTTVDAVLSIFFADVVVAEDSAEHDEAAGVSVESGASPTFRGRVVDVETGSAGVQAHLDVGGGTVRFDPNGIEHVNPGDQVQVTGETVHLVHLDEPTDRSRNA